MFNANNNKISRQLSDNKLRILHQQQSYTELQNFAPTWKSIQNYAYIPKSLKIMSEHKKILTNHQRKTRITVHYIQSNTWFNLMHFRLLLPFRLWLIPRWGGVSHYMPFIKTKCSRHRPRPKVLSQSSRQFQSRLPENIGLSRVFV